MMQYVNMIGTTELLVLILFVIPIIVVIAIVASRKSKNTFQEDMSDLQSNPPVTEENPDKIKNDQNNNSLNILKTRLAKGEITKAEYDELKKEFQ
ncbi:SHOCT domain-containing protein [Nitrosopumilus cobalaminigenes]|nr:SHOCT domain-containing protein [Nitrosopumilus cobalaminigenes]